MIKYPNSRNEKLMSKMLVTKRRHLYAPNWNPDDKSTSIPSKYKYKAFGSTSQSYRDCHRKI